MVPALLSPAFAACFVVAASATFVHFRGKVRLKFSRQLTDLSTFTAPYNALMYLFSAVPTTPILDVEAFPASRRLRENWEVIRGEALALLNADRIRAAQRYDDIAFNTFFKRGWRRFYLKWYDDVLPSAAAACPQTVALIESIPEVNAAMFAFMPARSRLGRHRDPFAGSLRYHLGLATPNSDACRIYVDGDEYAWRDGHDVLFDETFIHRAENATDDSRLILFCDVTRPLRTPILPGRST